MLFGYSFAYICCAPTDNSFYPLAMIGTEPTTQRVSLSIYKHVDVTKSMKEWRVLLYYTPPLGSYKFTIKEARDERERKKEPLQRTYDISQLDVLSFAIPPFLSLSSDDSSLLVAYSLTKNPNKDVV